MVRNKLKSLGIDVHDQVSVIRIINSLAITDAKKAQMLHQYLDESQEKLNTEAGAAAGFPV